MARKPAGGRGTGGRAGGAAGPSACRPLAGIGTLGQELGGLNGYGLFGAGAGMVAALGLLALLLALVGVYGVVASAARRRPREIGVRMALGARPGQILALLGQNLGIVGAGILAGAVVGGGIAKIMSSFVAGVSPFDPATYFAASAILAGAALLASYLPARRSSRLSPSDAPRQE